MNLINKNQIIKIIPAKIENFSIGTIISVCGDYFVVEINNVSLLMAGLEPEILISTDDYVVMFTSKINKVEHNKVFFSVPSKFNFIQKREYPRINVKIPVWIKKESAKNTEIEAETINIGGGGMQIVSSDICKQNDILNARFNLPNNKKINTLFEVLRCEDEVKKFLLSGKFKEISNFDKIAIIQFCFKRKLESKCKSKMEV